MVLIGHQKQWEFLTKSLEAGKISHAYLFEGQDKLGKRTLAVEFAKRILKEDITRRQHPDYVFIEPEKKEIKINQIRDFIWRLSLKSSSGLPKIGIIDQAHCLNSEAQNCFLKTLEEPPGDAIIILITAYPQMLVPTILSRCEVIKFYPLGQKEIEQCLKEQNIAKKAIEEIGRISMGKPGVAIDLTSFPPKLEKRRKIITDLIKILNASISSRFQYAKSISEDIEGVEEILDSWLWYFHQAFLFRITQGQRLEKTNSVKKSISKLSRVLKLIEETRFLIFRTNVNSRLALETLIMEF